MKYLVLLIALSVFITACVPEPEPIVLEEKPPVVQSAPAPAVSARVFPLPRIKVIQTRGDETILWGYDENNRLVLVNSSGKSVVLTYNNGNLVSIDDGVKPVTFLYEKGRLIGSQRGARHWMFNYSSKGKLVGIDNGEKVDMSYDSKGRLSSVRLNEGVSTEFEYDDQNRTRAMYRDRIRTDLTYDDKGRLKLMSRGDDHFVIAYWRYNLLSSLSGTMYGLKETVNYGPEEISLVSDVEQNRFASTYADEETVRMSAFNTFLFCTRFKKLPVLFDGLSWVLFREYMKGDITAYFLSAFLCEYLP
jgi:YD repeat-containing protein